MLELAVLGLLYEAPVHGYELRKQLSVRLGGLRVISYGSLYPALRRLLRAGLVWVNGWDACDITMPFGGFKQSGFGRDRSLHALHKYADLKAVTYTLSTPARA